METLINKDSATKKELENAEKLEKISDSIADKGGKVVGTILTEFYNVPLLGGIMSNKENKVIVERVSKVEDKLSDRYKYKDENYYYMRSLVERYILAPEELDSFVFDNYVDIINEDDFDKVEASDFLDFKIHDINEIKKFIDTIKFTDGIFILNSYPVKTKIVNLMIQNGYITPYLGIGKVGIVRGGPNTYEITYEGLKFVTLFFKKDFNKYLNSYKLGKTLVHEKEQLIKDNQYNLRNVDAIHNAYSLKDNLENFYKFIERINIQHIDINK